MKYVGYSLQIQPDQFEENPLQTHKEIQAWTDPGHKGPTRSLGTALN